LVKAGPDTTYRDVFERASIQVLAKIQNQHPQITGKSDRLLFSTGKIESILYVPVIQRSGNEIELAAGAAHGMTTKSQWAIYPFETHQVTSKTPKIGLVEITSVGAKRLFSQKQMRWPSTTILKLLRKSITMARCSW
jgi:hypothetical protein